MTEIDISKVLIEGDAATIMGVKYQRVEEPMTDEQKLTFLLNELKVLARKRHCYDGRGGDNLYYYTDDHDATFDDGSQYGLVSFARTLLEQIGVEFEYP